MTERPSNYQEVIEQVVTNGLGFDVLSHRLPEDHDALLKHLGLMTFRLAARSPEALMEFIHSIQDMRDQMSLRERIAYDLGHRVATSIFTDPDPRKIYPKIKHTAW